MSGGEDASMAKKRQALKGSKRTEADRSRLRKVISKLKRTFPDATCSLNYQDPLQLLVATILSAQCTDERVNMVTPKLFKAYPTAADLAGASQEDLEAIIRSTGFYKNKSKSIRGCCRALLDRHGGGVPATMEELTQLAGVGRKTANVVLGTAFGMAEGVVVDTHVKRLSGRLAFTEQTDPEKIEQDLMVLTARKDWISLPHLFIRHGRATCTARSPDCATCGLSALCPSAAPKG
jgi:endonuclease-3